jgi:2-desacetyl-2-hydroxyethyl bacteriochlorophyllide A dehydrogenase
MRYVELDEGTARLAEGPVPDRPPGWARVRVLACGVCGTDLHMLHGMVMPPGASYPVRPGHEVAGIVEEADPDAALTQGDVVVLHPLLTCGHCHACRAGDDQWCTDGRILGIHEPGGLAEQIVWPADRMLAVGDVEPALAAVLADAVATGHHAVKLARIPKGGAVCVIGSGGVGTQVLQIARALDPDVRLAAVVRTAASAERVRGLGVSVVEGLEGAVPAFRSEFGAFDAIVDFSGAPEAPAQAVRLLRRGGRLLVGSVVDHPLDLGPSSTVVTRELHIQGVFASSLADLAAVVDLVRAGQLDLSGTVTHRLPLERAPEAFGLLAERPPGMVRVVVDC